MNKKAEKYHSAEEWCHNVVKNGGDILFDVQLFDNEISKASEELGYPVESLNSFLRNVHLKHVKKKGSILRNSARHLIQKYYMKGMTIQNLAKKINSPPSMVARAIVEHLTNLNGSATNRRKVTEAIRDPIGKLNCPTIISEEYRDSENVTAINTTIRDNFSGRKILKTDQSQITRLAREVIEATNCDPLYGPRFDKERNFIGVEYEIVLERTLRRMGIPFETEDELRERGTARTPDILFSCPVAIRTSTRNDEEHDWKMICWIDSKALFGDVSTHQTSVLPQAETYVHRFGPGLILYWFGHAPTEQLGDGHGDVIVAGYNVPEIMLPTGELSSN